MRTHLPILFLCTLLLAWGPAYGQHAPSTPTAEMQIGTYPPPEIGAKKSFFLCCYNKTAQTFELVGKSEFHHLWLWLQPGDEGPTAEAINALNEAAAERTPPGSYNPDQGFIENLQEIFGPPPDLDGDGVVDILVYNLRGGVTSGWDRDPATGRRIDVIHVGWGDPDLFSAIAAHEYTHLLNMRHFERYLSREIDPPWSLFVVEGLGAYAMTANGWPEANPPDFYLDPGALDRPLLSFSGRNDYYRAGLFHLYLAEQFSPGVLREIMNNHGEDLFGAENLRDAVAAYGAALEDVVAGFHLANYLNDRALDARYGFETDGFRTHRLRNAPTAHALLVDGTDTTATAFGGFVPEGSAQYYAWEQVESLTLHADAASSVYPLDLQRSQLRLHVILEPIGGPLEVRPLTPGPEPVHFAGRYARVTLAAAHGVPEAVSGIPLRVNASWKPVSVAAEVPDLPQQVHLAQNHPNPFNPATTIAYRLDHPAHVRLAVYNALGQQVRLLLDDAQPFGAHTVVWDGRSDAGVAMPSGVYLYRMQVGGAVQSRAMLLVK